MGPKTPDQHEVNAGLMPALWRTDPDRDLRGGATLTCDHAYGLWSFEQTLAKRRIFSCAEVTLWLCWRQRSAA
jgi:hypothetical protein